MPPELIYLVGPPTAGKSTLLRGLLGGVPDGRQTVPFAWERYGSAAHLGWGRADYPGTDTLSMTVQPLVLAWLATDPGPLVLGEGDRLSTGAFFRGVVARGYRLTVIWLDLPWSELVRRMATRPAPQSWPWVRGRYTKVQALASGWVLPRWHLDATEAPEALLARVQQHPALLRWAEEGAHGAVALA